ncbi:MAG: hypothetical protein ACLQF1_17460 [Methyloceanibacter sp.]
MHEPLAAPIDFIESTANQTRRLCRAASLHFLFASRQRLLLCGNELKEKHRRRRSIDQAELNLVPDLYHADLAGLKLDIFEIAIVDNNRPRALILQNQRPRKNIHSKE